MLNVCEEKKSITIWVEKQNKRVRVGNGFEMTLNGNSVVKNIELNWEFYMWIFWVRQVKI